MTTNTERFSPFLDELLNPPEAETSTPMITTPSAPPVSFENALASGVIPTFDEQPDDKIPAASSEPLDHDAHVVAYREFLALINEHKDPDTIVTSLAPDAFAKGII
ncbi:MAG: hypothetical protein ABL901_00930 [Hyphomicrobiaceae bacterium]